MRDREFDILLQKYNKAISNIHDLQNTLETKEDAWEKISASTNKTFKLTRSLCEMILAKDKREMKLGVEYSWGSMPIDDLISNAMKCFREYNDYRTKLMNDLMDESEERLDKIYDLEDKLEALMTQGNIGSAEESAKFIEEMDKKKEAEKAAGKLSNAAKEAIETGGLKGILESDEDTDTETENAQQAILSQLAEENETVITSVSIPVKHAKKSKNIKEKAEENAKEISKDVIEDLKNHCDECMIDIIKILGDTGISKFTQLNKEIISKGYTKNSATSVAIKELNDNKLIEALKLKSPVAPTTFQILKLTQQGTRLYHLLTKQKAKESEMDKIYNEYGVLERGYGIGILKEILEKNSKYKNATMFNKKNPITIDKKIDYIPNIICDKNKGNGQDYYEYYIENINKSEFRNKCNQMVQASKTLYFIAQNKDVVNEIKGNIENWIDKKGQENLKGVIIKITTLKNLKNNNNLDDPGTWNIIYNLSQSKKPITNQSK